MRTLKMLIGLSAATALAFVGCEPAIASTTVDVGHVAAYVGAQIAPHDIACTKTGTLWTCRHGAAGDVIAQLQDYAQCATEDSCHFVYIPGPAGHTDDGRWFLVGDNP